MNPLVQMLTESDNKTHDVFKYLALLTIVIALGLEIFVTVWRNQPFDIQQFGIGVGVLFTGMGAALMMKPENKAPLTTTPPAIGQVP